MPSLLSSVRMRTDWLSQGFPKRAIDHFKALTVDVRRELGVEPDLPTIATQPSVWPVEWGLYTPVSSMFFRALEIEFHWSKVVTPFITLVAIAEQQAAGDKTGK
jgi:hypothetical protein